MNSIVGRTIVKVRKMTKKEAEQEGWLYKNTIVLELDDGTLIYPSGDEEGNHPGALFGIQNGKAISFMANY
jgi:hypothetical protein